MTKDAPCRSRAPSSRRTSPRAVRLSHAPTRRGERGPARTPCARRSRAPPRGSKSWPRTSGARPDAELLEGSLADLESLLERALRASLPADVLEEKRAEAEAQLRKYRGRMERATYEQTLDNLLAKALRDEAGVPRLSLFYL